MIWRSHHGLSQLECSGACQKKVSYSGPPTRRTPFATALSPNASAVSNMTGEQMASRDDGILHRAIMVYQRKRWSAKKVSANRYTRIRTPKYETGNHRLLTVAAIEKYWHPKAPLTSLDPGSRLHIEDSAEARTHHHLSMISSAIES